jgi:hypothetical protein
MEQANQVTTFLGMVEMLLASVSDYYYYYFHSKECRLGYEPSVVKAIVQRILSEGVTQGVTLFCERYFKK